MGLILDTCVFIRAEKMGKSLNFSKYETVGDVFMSVITVSELLMGVERANTPARRLKRSAFVEAIIKEIPIVEFTADIARIHATIYAALSKKGVQIGAHDLIIAATAIACGHAILTANKDEFNRVPGLKVLDL